MNPLFRATRWGLGLGAEVRAELELVVNIAEEADGKQVVRALESRWEDQPEPRPRYYPHIHLSPDLLAGGKRSTGPNSLFEWTGQMSWPRGRRRALEQVRPWNSDLCLSTKATSKATPGIIWLWLCR